MIQVAGGMLVHQGAPLRWLGANAYSLYVRRVTNASPEAFIEVIDMLAEAGVRVIRVFGDGFSQAGGMGLWVADPSTAEAHARVILDYAASKGVGVIWVLHWNVANIPAYAGEAVTELANPASASRAYINAVIDRVVTEFEDHPAVYAWEVANEVGAVVGITQAQQFELTEAMRLRVAGIDPLRAVSSGYATMDFVSQSGQDGQNPDAGLAKTREAHQGFSTWSTHIYASRSKAIGINGIGFGRWLSFLALRAKGAGSPLIVGEFGPSSSDDEENRLQFENMVQGYAETQNCQLALVWNCDVSDFSGNQANYIFNRSTRPWVLDRLKDYASLPASLAIAETVSAGRPLAKESP